jgi:hypothetical protein
VYHPSTAIPIHRYPQLASRCQGRCHSGLLSLRERLLERDMAGDKSSPTSQVCCPLSVFHCLFSSHDANCGGLTALLRMAAMLYGVRWKVHYDPESLARFHNFRCFHHFTRITISRRCIVSYAIEKQTARPGKQGTDADRPA